MILLALTAAAAPAQVMCSVDYAKPAPCTMTDMVRRDGAHVLRFQQGPHRIEFVGRSQTGWWSGTLDGKPAMGLEMNRGYTRFSTLSLGRTFDWFYPGQDRGTY
jgi:hypothetical protein